MGLFDFLKSKKKKGEPGPAPENDADVLAGLDDVDLSGLEQPETRYTREYQEFLASQETAEQAGTDAGEDFADAEDGFGDGGDGAGDGGD